MAISDCIRKTNFSDSQVINEYIEDFIEEGKNQEEAESLALDKYGKSLLIDMNNLKRELGFKEDIIEDEENNLDVRFQKSTKTPIFETYETSNQGRDSEVRERGLQEEARDTFQAAFNDIARNVGSAQDAESIKTQHQNAKAYAEANGILIKSLEELGTPTDWGGMENRIALNPEKGEVYKGNNLLVTNGSILDYLNYIQRHNHLFPNTPYELVAFHEITKNKELWMKPVVKQRYVKADREATQEEIDGYMRNRGYFSNNRKSFSYENGVFEISDLKPANVFIKDGSVFVIDDINKKFKEEEFSFQRSPEEVQTGKPFTFNYLKNKDKAPYIGSRFGQDVEPAGDYVIERETEYIPDGDQWEYGSATIKNPLVILVTTDTLVEWKRDLSKEYGGLTGKKLSQKLINEGYDGIITFDQNGYTGEIILLGGQRVDMQFQLTKPVEEVGDLVAMHNISTGGILNADKIGGLPMPSLAITKRGLSFENFGEVSLIADKSLVDPKVSGNRTFGADVYSPRYPSITYFPNQRQIEEAFGKYEADMPKDWKSSTSKLLQDMEDRGIESAKFSPLVRTAYLKENSKSLPKLKLEPKPWVLPELLNYVKQKNDKGYYSDHEAKNDTQIRPLIIKHYEAKYDREGLTKEDIELITPTIDELNDKSWKVSNIFREEISKALNPKKEYKTSEWFRDLDDKIGYRNDARYKKFEKWVEEKFSDIDIDEKIFKGFTYSGNKQWLDHNIDNVMKMLKADVRGGEGGSYGVGMARAAYTPQFKSIKDIRKAKDQLVDTQTFEKVKEEINEEFFKLSDKFPNTSNSFGHADRVINFLVDAGKNGIRREMKEYGWDLSESVIEDTLEFTEKLRNYPTEYFESKPKRVVQFNEFRAAVVPKDFNKEAEQILKNSGLKIQKYDPSKEGDRTDKMNSFLDKKVNSDIRFQKYNSSEYANDNFYSNSLRAIDRVPQTKGTFDQWKAMLLKNGASQSELDWIGFDEEFKGKKPTKEEVYEFIRANKVDVEEVVKGGNLVADAKEIQDKLDEISKKYGVNAFLEENPMDGEPYLDVEYEGIGIWMNGYIQEDDLPDGFNYQDLQEELDPIHKSLEYREADNDTKYSNHTLHGGENYKELLLTMPVKKSDISDATIWATDTAWMVRFSDGTLNSIPLDKADDKQEAYDQVVSGNPFKSDGYKSSHWDEPNILSHIRFNERTIRSTYPELEEVSEIKDFDERLKAIQNFKPIESRDEKVLFIEEIQSDWAQEGRKKGWKEDGQKKYLITFKNGGAVVQDGVAAKSEKEAKIKAWRMSVANADEMMSSFGFTEEQILNTYEAKETTGGVPDMPFKRTQDWLNLSMKRMIRYAAENGMDRIAWVTGEQSADRYDLSKQINDLEWDPSDNTLTAYNKDNRQVIQETAPPEKLEDYVGKEVAQKILDKQTERLAGDKEKVVIAALDGGMTKEQAEKDFDYLIKEPLDTDERPTSAVWKRLGDAVEGTGLDLNEIIHDNQDEAIKLDNLDLQVGGEGMKSFYNKIVPNTTTKLLKKLDKNSKVEVVEFQDFESWYKQNRANVDPTWEEYLELSEKEKIEYQKAFRDDLKANKKPDQQLSFPITPVLRQKALSEGLPLFQKAAVEETPAIEIKRGDLLRRSIQDRYVMLKRLQEGKAGDQLLDDYNAYVKENLQYGKANEKEAQYEEQIWIPFSKELKKLSNKGIKYDEVSRYLKAKHIVDDNIMSPAENGFKQAKVFKRKDGYFMVEIAKSTPDGEVSTDNVERLNRPTYDQVADLIGSHYADKVFSKVNSKSFTGAHVFEDIDQFKGGGIPMREAKELVDQMQSKVSEKELDKLHEFIQHMQMMSLNLQYESGIISKTKYDQLQKQYKFYVPLRGFNSVMDMDPTKFTSDFNRKGRTSESGDPISYLEQMVKTNIIKGEQNKVKVAFLNFLKDNPDSQIYSIENVWYLKQDDGSFEATNQTPTKEQIDDGIATRTPNVEGLDAEQIQKLNEQAILQSGDMVMTALENGRRVRIQFRGPEGEALVRAFKGTKTSKAEGVLKYLQAAHTRLRQLYTQYSPEFAFRNAVRDFISGAMNVRADYGNKVAADVSKYVISGKAWRTVQQGLDTNTKKDRRFDGKDGALFKEYLEQGAMTGYGSIKELSDVYKDKKSEIEGIKSNKLIQAGKTVRDFIDVQNSVIENTVRFATYRTLRNKGVSPQKAAIYAKDLTVNFNRKGEMSTSLNSIFLFFNAGVQGIDRLTRPYLSDDKKVKQRAYGNIALGASSMLGLIYQAIAMGGEDEDGVPYYFKLPDYTRTHHMVFAVGTNKFVTIPLPYGHNLPFAISAISMDVAVGEAKPKDASLMMLSAMFETFSPIGAPNFEGRPLDEAALEIVTPAILKPIADISWNRNFAGNPIYQEPFSKNAPEKPSSQMYFQSVNPTIKMIAEGVNSATGGSTIESGWLDVNPEKLEHVLTSYSGGVGSFINNAYTSAAYLIQGESILTEERKRKIPFFRNYYKEASPYYDQSRFYDLLGEAKKRRDIYKGYVDMGMLKEAKDYLKNNRDYFKVDGGIPVKRNGRWNNPKGIDTYKDKASTIKAAIKVQEDKIKAAKSIGAPTKANERKIEEYEKALNKIYTKVYKLVGDNSD